MKKLLIIGAILGSIMSEHNVTVAMNQEQGTAPVSMELQRKIDRINAEILETQVEIVALERLLCEHVNANNNNIQNALTRRVGRQIIPDRDNLPGSFMKILRIVESLDRKVHNNRRTIQLAASCRTIEELEDRIANAPTPCILGRDVCRDLAKWLTGERINDGNMIIELYETNDPDYQAIYNLSPLTPPRRNTPVQTYEHLYVDA